MTNDIEGVISTRREIQAILDNGHRSKGKRFFGLVNKYNKLIKEEYDFIISCQDIYNLYEEIMLADIKSENDTNIPDASLFRKDGVVIYLNGRINRLIASCYLKQEMDVLCALQVSIGCKEQQSKYYEAFKICNDVRNRGDITPFILMFLEIYRDGLKRLQETIVEKVSQLSYHMNAINNYKDSDLYEILDYFIQSSLFARGGLTMKQLGKLMGCSEPTVRSRIKEIHDTEFENAFKIDTSHKPHI